MTRLLNAGLALVAAALAGCATPPPPSAAVPAADGPYGAADAWLCRPGRADLCGTEQTVTVVAADGSRQVQTLKPLADAPIDCFYVYPTISEDPEDQSTLTPGPGEKRAVAQQFAPFSSVCRPFAPMYRQVTLAGLRAVVQGRPSKANPEIAIGDVQAAWRHYLRHDNRGRGVVLIGHSQGSRMLVELIKREIEGKPEQKLLVSAMLIGFNVTVPASGAGAGGTFRQLPLCKTAGDTGCVIAYVSYRASAPPPDNARFGRSNTPGVEVACVDPVRMSGVPLRAMFATDVNLLGRPDPAQQWNAMVSQMQTAFVSVPGLFDARCVNQGPNSYLALALDAAQRGARPAEIPGELVVNGRVLADWGLHLIDINVVMGNLLETARVQGVSFGARR